MNLLRFLKSTKGAIKPLNALLISGAAGAVFAYTVNTAANKQIQAERAVRTLSGISPDGKLVETVELSDRPFHVGVQYHPEFKSRPNRPHPLFVGFIGAALERAGADADKEN